MTVQLLWVRSQRDRVRTYENYTRPRLRRSAQYAEQAGMKLRVVTPDEFAFHLRSDGKVATSSSDDRLDPAECIVHSAAMTWPANTPDVWHQQTLFQTLQDLGFCLTCPPWLNDVVTDKYGTLARLASLGMPVLPTARVMTRQFTRIQDVMPVETLAYPLAVKPSNWAGGYGIMRVNNRPMLDAVLQLAGASELAVVLQPWVDGLRDYRVYCFNGVPGAATVRTGRSGRLIASVSGGAALPRVDVPAWAAGLARQAAEAFPVPYLCVDFVAKEDRFWLSGVEVDGGIPEGPEYEDLALARFHSYRQHLDGATAHRPFGARGALP